ncbi:MAG: hypothetical protein JO103_14755 [Candidatus Eremiobacteraeota bacterium]|nr:hypothetical protein [Candidatus Eremiobacteraeota bacterium]MBV9407184.1 hypothetical protein [Candidatus Eremiobacteraeota bacterium]
MSGAAAAQALAVDVLDSGPRVEHQAKYAQAGLIDVRVTARNARSAVLLGVAPDGTNLRIPLARIGGDVFAGSAQFASIGTWSLAIATSTATGQETTPSFPIVVDAGPSTGDVALMVALAIVSVCGGIGLIAVGRTAATARACV